MIEKCCCRAFWVGVYPWVSVQRQMKKCRLLVAPSAIFVNVFFMASPLCLSLLIGREGHPSCSSTPHCWLVDRGRATQKAALMANQCWREEGELTIFATPFHAHGCSLPGRAMRLDIEAAGSYWGSSIFFLVS